MTLDRVFGFLQSINLTEATQRKDFRDRMQHGQAVSLAETIYGTLMGIDSVELKTDIEIGGIDQLLNFQQTRTVQRSQGQKAEEIIMTPIIEGTSGDGRKMSKSYGNYVPVMASSEEIFGKIMSIPDTLIVPYLKAFAPIYKKEVFRLEEEARSNPLELKKQLGSYMVSIAASCTADGLEARENFERRFSSRVITAEDAKPLNIANNLLNTLMQSGDFNSLAEIRRLAQQGGIKINGTKISPEELMESHESGSIVSVGKRKIYSLLENE
jgi:tyrosyl-tRNA synthetase